MLRRNEVALAIAKINRVTKVAIKENYDTSPGEFRGVIERDFSYIVLWSEEIKAFWKDNPTASLTDDILCLLPPAYLMTQYQSGRTVLDRKDYQTLVAYNRVMTQLQADCLKLVNKGLNEEFVGLPDALVSDKALDMLKTGVEAGLLDSHYLPLSNASPQQLKILAFGIATKMNFKKTCFWAPLNELWNMDLGKVHLPLLRQGSIQQIMDLFPSVDFGPLFKTDENLFFTCPYNKSRIKTLYKSLLMGGYISPQTRETQMMGMFALDRDTEPVNWIQAGRLLAYFVRCALSQNDQNMWRTAASRFLINGEKVNVGTMKSATIGIKKISNWDEYDPALKAIADSFIRNSRVV